MDQSLRVPSQLILMLMFLSSCLPVDLMLWSLDAIEENMARLQPDSGPMLVVPISLLPSGAREGQILRVTPSADGTTATSVTFTIQIDDAATAQALARSRATTSKASNDSRRRDPGGNVAL